MPTRRTAKPAVALVAAEATTDDARRALLAEWCRLVGRRVGGASDPSDGPAALNMDVAPPADPVAALNLPPRVGQTLARLLAGRSEKQIALDLGLSPHTVHTYVKQLHKRFDVSSRGELLARFVAGAPAAAPVTRSTKPA